MKKILKSVAFLLFLGWGASACVPHQTVTVRRIAPRHDHGQHRGWFKSNPARRTIIIQESNHQRSARPLRSPGNSGHQKQGHENGSGHGEGSNGGKHKGKGK